MSFQKFMNKKDFHPGSFRNIKMAWLAEEKTRVSAEEDANLKAQYEREQESYRNKQQMAGSGGKRLQLNFMYDAPPGMSREDMVHEGEEAEIGADGLPKLKMGTKKAAAKTTDSLTGGEADIGSKRHIQCYRCSRWGHANTDKICPMFNVPRDEDKFVQQLDAMKLIREMRHDGFAMNPSLYGGVINVAQRSQELIMSEEEDEDSLAADDLAAVSKLSKKQKRKLLRKLNSAEGQEADLSELLAAAQGADAAQQDKERNASSGHHKSKKQHRKSKHRPREDDEHDIAESDDRRHRDRSRSPRQRHTGEYSPSERRRGRDREGDERHRRHRSESASPDRRAPHHHRRRRHTSDDLDRVRGDGEPHGHEERKQAHRSERRDPSPARSESRRDQRDSHRHGDGHRDRQQPPHRGHRSDRERR